MNDVSDLIFTMASIVIFSFLLLQANHAMVRNDVVMVEHEYENSGISLAQSLINEARMTAFDETTEGGGAPESMPSGFREQLGPPVGISRPDFTVFDYYHGYSDTITTQLGSYVMDVTVSYVNSEPPYEETGGPTFSKKLEATVREVQTEQSARLSYIKTYY
ncbi:MAG: hypothetical protein WD097_08360 [Balneolales bacterium]